MKDLMELPIEYDVHRLGYYFSSPVSDFPLLKLTEGELFAIFVGEKALGQYIGTPYEKPLRNTFEKFTAGLSGELYFQWTELQNAISFKSIEANTVDARVFQQLVIAIRQRCEVVFDYQGLKDTKFKGGRVHADDLVSAENQWDLFALDVKSQKIKRFVPGRMRALQTTKTSFLKPNGFSVAKELENSFSIFSGSRPTTVEIVFDRFAGRLVRERHWHSSQHLTELKGGKVKLSLVVGGFEEIERWLLSWGDHAQVLSPPELIHRLQATMTRCLEIYTDPK